MRGCVLPQPRISRFACSKATAETDMPEADMPKAYMAEADTDMSDAKRGARKAGVTPIAGTAPVAAISAVVSAPGGAHIARAVISGVAAAIPISVAGRANAVAIATRCRL